jgi:hypothetical protein
LGYNVNQMPAGWWNGAGNDNANGTFNGPIPVNQLTTDDTAFLAAAARIMGGGFDPRNIASGDHNSVSAALGSDTMKGLHAAQHDTAGFLANRVSPQVRAAMEQMVAQNPAMQARWNQFISQSDGSGHGSRNEGLVQKHQADSMAQTAATSAAATAYARAHPGQVSSNTMNPYNVPQPPTAPNPLNLPGQGGARPDATGGGFLPTASANDISKQYKKPKLGKVNTMQPTRGTA